jgi:RNA polymerase sigma-70 factor (ECF subfamily)
MQPKSGFGRVNTMAILNMWRRRADAHAQFEQLLQPHLSQLYRLAYRFTGQRDDAEDLVQDLLLKLYPRMAEIESLDNPAPWLARVLYHQYIDRIRRQQRSPLQLMGEEEIAYEIHPDDGAQPSQEMENEIRGRMLQQALNELNEDQRMAVMLHDVEGYSLQEIENILGVTQGTLKSRLSRARGKLREKLQEMEPDSQFVRVNE